MYKFTLPSYLSSLMTSFEASPIMIVRLHAAYHVYPTPPRQHTCLTAQVKDRVVANLLFPSRFV